MTKKRIELLIVEDRDVILAGLQSFVQDSDVVIAVEVRSEEEALRLVNEDKFDAVLVDTHLGGGNGFSTLRKVKRKWPRLPVLMWSCYDNPTYLARADALGASAYLDRGVSRQEFLSTIQASVENPSPRKCKRLREMAKSAKAPRDLDIHFTPRELDVLRQLSFGLSNKEIAGALSVGYETVKEHVQHVLHKLKVSDRTQAAVWAVRNGIR